MVYHPQYSISNSNLSIVINFIEHLINNKYICNNVANKEECRKCYFQCKSSLNSKLCFYGMILHLIYFKFIEKRKNKDQSMIYFKPDLQNLIILKKSATVVPKIEINSNQNLTHQNANDKPKNYIRKKTLVSQRVALPSTRRETKYLSEEKCDLCSVKFQNKSDYDKHITDAVHELRQQYRTNRKQFNSKNMDISIEIRKNTELIETDIKSTINTETTLSLNIKNNSSDEYKITDIIFLYTKLKDISFVYNLPIVITGKSFKTISVKYKFKHEGVYLYPIMFKAENISKNSSNYILKELMLYIQSEEVNDLLPTVPYKRGEKAAVTFEELPIIDGERPERSSQAELTYISRLEAYTVGSAMLKILNSGLKMFSGMTPQEQQKLIELKQLLRVADRSNCLTAANYCEMLKTLLNIEEHQMQKNIRDYDCEKQKLTRVRGKPHLLSLNVPGLSENRPSLIRGDDLLVRIPGDQVRYKGYVHLVHQTSVDLGFFKRFVKEIHHDALLYDVSFGFNRHTLKTEHQAIELVRKHRVEKHFFPYCAPPSPKLTDKQFDWFEKKIINNAEQKQAVRHIFSRTSYPIPYLLFGPPGTGKTMTMVESILQLWKLEKKDCNILVAAPSNSAANEVTSRLVKFIPKTDLFRMVSASFTQDNIADNIKQYCNIKDGEYFYPSLEKLMSYRILIVTLTAAAKLVNAGISPDHFSYVFIDESGHATESEVLIPIAGIITSQFKKGNLHGQIVLAGDPKQLGPIIHSKLAESYGFGTSMLERLMNHYDVYKRDTKTDKYNPNVVTKLLKNFRSHPAILELPDEMFYEKELIPMDLNQNDMIKIALNWEHLPNKKFPLIFHCVKGKDEREENSPSYFNVQEIDVVLKYLGNLIGNRLNGRKIETADIGIVSPYRKQVQKLQQACRKKNWNNILIGSVEQFQGQERLIIIISTVRSTQELLEHDYRFHLGFLKNPKRFNVAITRAKALVIVIGNADILQCDEHWGRFIEYCIKNKATAGQVFTFNPKWAQANNNNNEIADDYLKSSLDCDTNIDNRELSYEHADFSRGNL